MIRFCIFFFLFFGQRMGVRFLINSAIVLVLIGFVSHFLLGEVFSGCNWSRFSHRSNPDRDGAALVSYTFRRVLAEGLPQILWVGFLFEKLYLRKYFEALWMAMYLVLWFPGLLLVRWLKRSSGDAACSSRSNGVSGHFFYFAWALATLLLQKDRLTLLAPNPRRIMAAFVFFFVVFGVQGYFTLIYGYHSFRQCLLGALCGVIWAAGSWESVEWIKRSLGK